MNPEDLEAVPVGGYVFAERDGRLTPIKKTAVPIAKRIQTVIRGTSFYTAYFFSGSAPIMVSQKPIKGELTIGEIQEATPETVARFLAQEKARAEAIESKAREIAATALKGRPSGV